MGERFAKFCVAAESPAGLVKTTAKKKFRGPSTRVSNKVGKSWDLGIYISNKFPGDSAGSLGTTV